MKLLKSASKFVFVLMAITICAAFSYEVFVGRVTLDVKDFMVLAGGAFAFYFSHKGNPTEEYLGK